MERALKQILGLLEEAEFEHVDKDTGQYDRVQASIDDVKTMLECIK